MTKLTRQTLEGTRTTREADVESDGYVAKKSLRTMSCAESSGAGEE